MARALAQSGQNKAAQCIGSPCALHEHEYWLHEFVDDNLIGQFAIQFEQFALEAQIARR